MLEDKLKNGIQEVIFTFKFYIYTPLEKVVHFGQHGEGKQKKFEKLTVKVRKHESKIQFERV